MRAMKLLPTVIHSLSSYINLDLKIGNVFIFKSGVGEQLGALDKPRRANSFAQKGFAKNENISGRMSFSVKRQGMF